MFIIGLDLAEVSRPLVKMVNVAVFQHICLQISHHGVKLTHRIRDGRAYTHKLSIMISLIYRRRKRTSSTAFLLKTEMNL